MTVEKTTRFNPLAQAPRAPRAIFGLARRAALCSLLLALSACEQSPTKPDEGPLTNLAEVYALAAKAYEAQNWAESEKHYATLTQQAPGEAEPWFKLGNIYARTFRADRALQSYRETLVREPLHKRAWHNMGIVQLREAANSFSELQQLVEPEDALYKKSVTIQKGVDELVN